MLTRAECLQLLRTAEVGRVAYSDGALPAITPVTFAMDGDAVVFRTTGSSRLAAGTASQVVAFEADERTSPASGWSVVVVGEASEVAVESERLRALQLRIAPWAAGDGPHFVRIVPTLVTGRRLVPPRPAGEAVSSSRPEAAAAPSS